MESNMTMNEEVEIRKTILQDILSALKDEEILSKIEKQGSNNDVWIWMEKGTSEEELPVASRLWINEDCKIICGVNMTNERDYIEEGIADLADPDYKEKIASFIKSI